MRVRDDPINPWLVLYFLLGTIIFYLASGPLAYFFASSTSEYLPNYNTGSSTFTSLYYRYTVNTTYFSVGVAVFFVVMYAIGFAFVEVVNL